MLHIQGKGLNVSKRFIVVYFMRDRPDRIRDVAPQHALYWRGLELPGYQGGPFADRSGGLISFQTESLSDAEQLAASDPFVTEDLLSERWVKEWQVE